MLSSLHIIYSAPPWVFLPSAAMGLNVLCEGSGLLNFNCITIFILIMINYSTSNSP